MSASWTHTLIRHPLVIKNCSACLLACRIVVLTMWLFALNYTTHDYLDVCRQTLSAKSSPFYTSRCLYRVKCSRICESVSSRTSAAWPDCFAESPSFARAEFWPLVLDGKQTSCAAFCYRRVQETVDAVFTNTRNSNQIWLSWAPVPIDSLQASPQAESCESWGMSFPIPQILS